MPLFYFDVYDGLSGPDRVGADCPDHEVACQEARRRVRRLVADQPDWFPTGQLWQIGIVEAEAALTTVLRFRCSTDAIILIQDDDGSAPAIPAACLRGPTASGGKQAN